MIPIERSEKARKAGLASGIVRKSRAKTTPESMREYQRKYMMNYSKSQKHKDYVKEYRSLKSTKDRWLLWNRKYFDSCKESAINMYSNGDACCLWCRQADIDVLCLDHVNNNGKEERSKYKTTRGMYHRLRKQDYPYGFQVLCFNCNMKKEIVLRRQRRKQLA